jgi:hypothetical protein
MPFGVMTGLSGGCVERPLRAPATERASPDSRNGGETERSASPSEAGAHTVKAHPNLRCKCGPVDQAESNESHWRMD